MKKLRSILGHTGAILGLVLAVVSPFLLFGWFQHAIASAGLRIDPEYTGGEIARTIDRGAYRIAVYQPVWRRSPIQRIAPFVQLTWAPAASLPETVSDAVDLDGDGVADIRVTFRPAALAVDVASLNGKYRSVHSQGVTSFSQLIARVNERIVLRLPLD